MRWCLHELPWLSRIFWFGYAWSCVGVEDRSPIQVMVKPRRPGSRLGPTTHKAPPPHLQSSQRWHGHCCNLTATERERTPCYRRFPSPRQPFPLLPKRGAKRTWVALLPAPASAVDHQCSRLPRALLKFVFPPLHIKANLLI